MQEAIHAGCFLVECRASPAESLTECGMVRPDALDVTGSCGVVGLAGLAAGQEGLLEGSAGLLAW